MSDNEYAYEHQEIKDLIYDFDILSANKHLGGEWTHESLFEEMIIDIESFRVNDNVVYLLGSFSTANCQINNVTEYWNYYRIWADQLISNTLANKYIGAANVTGSISVIAEFIAEGFKAVGMAGYSATASIVSMLAGYHSGHRTSLANAIKNNNWNCGTMHEIDKYFAHVWKVEAQGIR